MWWALPRGTPFEGERSEIDHCFSSGDTPMYISRAGCTPCSTLPVEVSGVGAGVLLRALEPLDGIHLMRLRRAQAPLIDLAKGPGRLAQAMGIGLRDDGLDLCAAGPLWLGNSVGPVGDIGRSVRIGISRETQRLLRFYERGSPYISGSKRLTA